MHTNAAAAEGTAGSHASRVSQASRGNLPNRLRWRMTAALAMTSGAPRPGPAATTAVSPAQTASGLLGSAMGGVVSRPGNSGPRRSTVPSVADNLRYRSPGPRGSALVAALVGLLASVALRSPMPLLLLPPTAAVLALRRKRRRGWAERDAQRDAIAALCTAVRAELETGLQPQAAFVSAVWSRPELLDLAEATTFAGADLDLPRLLAEHAARPGRRALRSLSACWYAAERHGLALENAVGGIEEGLRAEQARLRSVEVELAGIRATILLLATLPLFGLALGFALGADPLGMLLYRPAGRLGLALGTALDLAGLLWTDRLVAALRPEESVRTSFRWVSA